MSRRTAYRKRTILGWFVAGLLPLTVWAADAEDANELQEKALKAAALKVAPSVVQIETTGGTEIISTGPRGAQVRKGVGPTTGLIVSADGYIISSAFNFANKPTAIHVSIPGSQNTERYIAKVIATDQTRMLTLLKIDATGLPVPTAAPKAQISVGQWAVALGRALDSNMDHPPSMSIGIISALGRVWGKAVQTDAKVSPVNYGGPLVDIQGRVQGVLVPASPRAQDETAGVEWYDSGIGFAVPLEDINAVLPRLKEGKDLKRGLLGITLQSADMYGALPVIGTVAPESAAARIGLQPGDHITEIDGHPVVRYAQILHLIGSKYEGDEVAVKVKRGGKEVVFDKVKLSGVLATLAHSFIGILPMRDDPELGVAIRYVYPQSPADKAGLKAGDRIMKVAAGKGKAQAFSGRDQLAGFLNGQSPGADVQLEVTRKEGNKTETVTVKLAALTDAVPEKLPQPASVKKALEPRKTVAPPKPMPKADEPKKEEKKEEKKKAETGLLKRTDAARDHEYWVYVPENYDPNIAHALVVWLHPARKLGKEAESVAEVWQDYCTANHMIMIGPKAENENGWIPSETEAILQTVNEILGQYSIDRDRIVAHGMGVGGQMAFYLGFSARDLIRGVATTGAVLTRDPKDNVANQRLSFFIVAGGKDPLAKDIAESKTKLTERKFAVTYREITDMGHQYLDFDEKVLEELVRWIDSLDKL